MNALPFGKIEAAGNDFIVLTSTAFLKATEIQELCHLHTGIGADGLIEFFPRHPQAATQKEQTWEWRFWNADGSSAAMCGNAARALAPWFHRHFPKETHFTWRGSLGEISAEYLSPQESRATWPLPSQTVEEITDLSLSLLPTEATLAFVDSGVPHVVLEQKKPWPRGLRAELAPVIRHHQRWAPMGANVTFISTEDSAAVTFERGVEAETLACGSGALAVFLCARHRNPQLSQIHLQFPGGVLKVEQEPSHLWLRGPARFLYEGIWNPA